MSEFVFADDYRLERGSTRTFYETFLKGFVHKHNNLMGVVQGFSSLILYDEGISDEIRDSTQQMHDASKTATDLNKEVLATAGTSEFSPTTLNLNEILPFLMGKSKDICDAKGVALQFNPAEGLPAINGDASKITDVLVALVNNAAESAASFPSGSVAIDVFPPGKASSNGNVDLFIRNTSADLTLKKLKEAFVPFESSKGNDHYGIGLTLASIIAGDLGIRLGLRSAEGTMTTWLSIPPAA